jgi:hypothetical protein
VLCSAPLQHGLMSSSHKADSESSWCSLASARDDRPDVDDGETVPADGTSLKILTTSSLVYSRQLLMIKPFFFNNTNNNNNHKTPLRLSTDVGPNLRASRIHPRPHRGGGQQQSQEVRCEDGRCPSDLGGDLPATSETPESSRTSASSPELPPFTAPAANA